MSVKMIILPKDKVVVCLWLKKREIFLSKK